MLQMVHAEVANSPARAMQIATIMYMDASFLEIATNWTGQAECITGLLALPNCIQHIKITLQ